MFVAAPHLIVSTHGFVFSCLHVLKLLNIARVELTAIHLNNSLAFVSLE
jgi:hypothetical protein